MRSAATTEVPTGSKELGDQITRLMAALTQAEQDSHPVNAPNSPRHRGHGRGWTDRNTPAHTSSYNGQTGLSQTTSAHSSSITNKGGTKSPNKGNQHVHNGVQGGTQSNQGSSSLQCFRCQGWGHMARECATLATPLNQEGGPKGMQSNPLQQSTVSPQHSLCDPEPKLTQAKAVHKKGWKEIDPILFLNPDPVV